MFPVRRISLAAIVLCSPQLLWAQTASSAQVPEPETALQTVTVEASADASAQGLAKPFAGGQVATGARNGILGTRDWKNSSFSSTAYTSQLIEDTQSKSVGDVLLSDPSVRQARGFGNFQELYMLRGMPVYSDDIAYNGLYGLLPRQYVASEFFERVEVLRGANAFLNGAAPGGSGVGGVISLLPKRAGNDALTQVSTGIQTGGQAYASADVSRRFGPDQSTGVRLNAVRRDGGTGIKDEDRSLTALGVGLDWRSRDVRLSADVGYQRNSYRGGRPSVTPSDFIPAVPDNKTNYAQSWTRSTERDLFATMRGEWDLNATTTAWAAGGLRRSKEDNINSGVTVLNANGDTTGTRFDNVRKDRVGTAEAGIRTRLQTGSVGHELVASASTYSATESGAWAMASGLRNNLYNPYASVMPENTFFGGSMANPYKVGETRFDSLALSDTLSMYDDRLQVTLGLRRQRIDQTSYDYNSGLQTDSYKKSATTPALGAVFKVTDDVSVYANYIEALTKGAVAPATANSLPVLNAGQVFSPYKSKQKELGVKWQRGTMGATAALYTTDVPSSYVVNQMYGQYGKQRNQGMEFTVFGEAAKGLRVLGGLTLTQAKIKQAADASQVDRYAIGVPKTQATLGVDWDVPGVSGLALNARVTHTSSQYANAANSMKVAGWTRTDIGARYLVDLGNDRMLTLRARLDNVFDKNYWASVGGYPGANYLVQSAPRTLSVSATVNF
ncbi:TonB-dependent receptor [Comamonas suwonensis]|uniref:TonB-dependent receptor n=1 Tax=Comamonas suwonensis TaxID=2606214 RepID=A0A843B5M3_9BURK|nr:TonB-dependent receptor [Comamonas suwonensis]MBI1626081.1 TonB-dependent receptor [Comamonas suwonensis]